MSTGKYLPKIKKKKYSDVAGFLSARVEYYNGLQLTVIMKIKIYQNYLFNILFFFSII